MSLETRDFKEPRERWGSRETREQLVRLVHLVSQGHLDYLEPLDSKV